MNQQLSNLRSALVVLHKALLEAERVSYDRTVGEVRSANHFLQLVTSAPWFAWLHPLSQLIVAIDETQEGNSAPSSDDTNALATKAHDLIVGFNGPKGIGGRYFDSLQTSPDVVLAHARIVELLGRARAAPRE